MNNDIKMLVEKYLNENNYLNENYYTAPGNVAVLMERLNYVKNILDSKKVKEYVKDFDKKWSEKLNVPLEKLNGYLDKWAKILNMKWHRSEPVINDKISVFLNTTLWDMIPVIIENTVSSKNLDPLKNGNSKEDKFYYDALVKISADLKIFQKVKDEFLIIQNQQRSPQELKNKIKIDDSIDATELTDKMLSNIEWVVDLFNDGKYIKYMKTTDEFFDTDLSKMLKELSNDMKKIHDKANKFHKIFLSNGE